jgi:hypothetical protein
MTTILSIDVFTVIIEFLDIKEIKTFSLLNKLFYQLIRKFYKIKRFCVKNMHEFSYNKKEKKIIKFDFEKFKKNKIAILINKNNSHKIIEYDKNFNFWVKWTETGKYYYSINNKFNVQKLINKTIKNRKELDFEHNQLIIKN